MIHGIDLDVAEGECVALIGANGAGKTTTLRTICGLIAPKAGSIRLREREIGGLSGHAIVREGVVMCPEGRQVFPQMTVVQNLRTRGSSRPRKVRTLRNAINSLFLKSLRETELDEIMDALVKKGHVAVEKDNVTYQLHSTP